MPALDALGVIAIEHAETRVVATHVPRAEDPSLAAVALAGASGPSTASKLDTCSWGVFSGSEGLPCFPVAQR